ncbi:hypothetical protein P3G55_02940 [Leptospira sp. 96542]|nr:hypothetical protein [Leptospira sp. 96542]
MKKISIFVLFILATQVFAINTVILKNGTNVKGTVIGQDDKGLTIKSADGTNQTYSKNQILKVIYKDLSEQEAASIRIAEEKKIKEKEEKERLKKEKEEQLANEREKKRLEEEIKKQDILSKTEEEKIRNMREKEAKAEADWLANRKLGPSKATMNCGGKWNILWRSALLPGWGQWCAGNKGSAIGFAGAFLGTTYYTLGTLQTSNDNTKNQYENLSLLNQLVGPPAQFTAQNISLPNEFIGVFLAASITDDFVAKSKQEAQVANAKYIGGLSIMGIIYISNIINAFWIGKDTYPERPKVSLFGKEIKEGFDWETKWDNPETFLPTKQQFNSTYGEIRYSLFF